MSKSNIIVTEVKALAKLVEEGWYKAGELLVSREAYSPEAVRYYARSISQETKEALKLQVRDYPRGSAGAKQFVADARSMEEVMGTHGLTLKDVPEPISSRLRFSPSEQLTNLYDSLADDVRAGRVEIDEGEKERAYRNGRLAVEKAIERKRQRPGPRLVEHPSKGRPEQPENDPPTKGRSK